MTEAARPIAGEHIDATQLLKPEEAVQQLPGIKSYHSLQWLLRHRRENGMLKAGAVIEFRARPGSSKVRLLINMPRMLAWIEGGGGGA